MNRRLFPLLALLSVVCGACQFIPFAQQPSNSSTAANSQTAQADRAPGTAAHAQAAGTLPAQQTYDLQFNKDQVWARLTGISFAEDSIIVNMAVTNGTREIIQLNGEDDMILYDDVKERSTQTRGNTYKLALPPDNPKLIVQPGTTMNGQFVFIGRVPPQATFLGSIANSSKIPNMKQMPRIEFKDILIKR